MGSRPHGCHVSSDLHNRLTLCAQTYPSKPVRLILPYPPGGATDILGRIIGQKFADQFGQPFVPENRPGAGGNIGTEIAAKAQPDGYTIVLASPALVISPGLYKKLNYDPIKDLAPISMVLQGPYVLLVRPSLPVKSSQGTGRIRESQARQTQFRRRHRHAASSRRRTAQQPRQDQDGTRAVQGCEPGDDRPDEQ